MNDQSEIEKYRVKYRWYGPGVVDEAGGFDGLPFAPISQDATEAETRFFSCCDLALETNEDGFKTVVLSKEEKENINTELKKMNNQPATHEALTAEFTNLLRPFRAEKISGQCADIVVRERMKILSLKSLSDEQMGTIALERVRSYSDKSTGEWVNPNPHAEEPRE